MTSPTTPSTEPNAAGSTAAPISSTPLYLMHAQTTQENPDLPSLHGIPALM
jgi:hypothetical protein